MKRFALNIICSLASFALGVAAFSILNSTSHRPTSEQPQASIVKRCPTEAPTPAAVPSPSESPNPEVVFADGLRIVPDDVEITSESLRYKVGVTYPQIVGSNAPQIRSINRRLKELATEQYDWPLQPSKDDLRYYREKWPDAFNSVIAYYEIVSTNESFLSVYFNAYSYGIGAAHSVQYSFVYNYDFTLRMEARLADIFKPRSDFLEFISQYCTKQLSKQREGMFKDALIADSDNFESWNITRDGIRFNFDACKVFSCADGEQTVEIPFADLKPMLSKRALKMFAQQ